MCCHARVLRIISAGCAHSASSPLLQSSTRSKSSTAVFGISQPKSLMVALDSANMKSSTSFRFFAHSELSASTSDFVHFSLFTLLRSFAWFNPSLTAMAETHSRTSLSLQFSTYPESSVLVFGVSRLEMSPVVLDLVHFGSSSLSRGLAYLGLFLLVLAEAHYSMSTILQGFARFGSSTLALSAVCLDFSLSVLDPTTLEVLLFLRSFARLGVSLFAVGVTELSVSSLLRSSPRPSLLLPICSTAHMSLSLLALGLPHSSFLLPARLMVCPEMLPSAPDFAHFGSLAPSRISAHFGAVSSVDGCVRLRFSLLASNPAHFGSLPLSRSLARLEPSCPVSSEIFPGFSSPPRSLTWSSPSSVTLDFAHFDSLLSARSLAQLNPVSSVSDFAQFRSSMLLRSFAWFGLSLIAMAETHSRTSLSLQFSAYPESSVPVFGVSRLEMSPVVLDLVHFGSSSLSRGLAYLGLFLLVLAEAHFSISTILRGFARFGSSTLALSAVCLDLSSSVLDPTTLEVLLFLQSFARLGVSLFAVGVTELSVSSLLRSFMRPSLSSSVFGVAQLGVLPSVLDRLTADPSISMRNFACLGFPPSASSSASFESFLFARSFAQVGLSPSASGFGHSEPLFAIRSSTRSDSPLPVSSFCHADAFLTVRMFPWSETAVVVVGAVWLSLSSMVLDFVNFGLSSLLQSTSRSGSILLVLDRVDSRSFSLARTFAQLSLLTSASGIAWSGFSTFAFDRLHLGAPLSVRASARLGPSPVVSDSVYLGVSLLVRSVPCHRVRLSSHPCVRGSVSKVCVQKFP